MAVSIVPICTEKICTWFHRLLLPPWRGRGTCKYSVDLGEAGVSTNYVRDIGLELFGRFGRIGDGTCKEYANYCRLALPLMGETACNDPWKFAKSINNIDG